MPATAIFSMSSAGPTTVLRHSDYPLIRRRVSRGLSPIGGNHPDVNQCCERDAFFHIDLTLPGVPSSDQRGRSLYACGFHRAVLLDRHRPDLPFRRAHAKSKALMGRYGRSVAHWLAIGPSSPIGSHPAT